MIVLSTWNVSVPGSWTMTRKVTRLRHHDRSRCVNLSVTFVRGSIAVGSRHPSTHIPAWQVTPHTTVLLTVGTSANLPRTPRGRSRNKHVSPTSSTLLSCCFPLTCSVLPGSIAFLPEFPCRPRGSGHTRRRIAWIQRFWSSAELAVARLPPWVDCLRIGFLRERQSCRFLLLPSSIPV